MVLGRLGSLRPNTIFYSMVNPKATMKPMILRLSILLLMLGGCLANAETRGPPKGWGTSFKGGSVHQFDSELEGLGDFSLHRYYGEAGLAYLFRVDRMIAFSVGYGQDDYNFKDLTTAPWNNVDNFRAGVFSRWAFENKWTSFAAGSVRAYGESDVALSEALTGALFGGASYRFNDGLSLGPGLGVVGQLDDQPMVFPIIVVDWNITEKLNLSTGGGLAATSGPGLSLSYKMTKHWRAGLTGRYENKRFRLSKDGAAPSGVGEDRNIPLLGTLSYVLYPGTQLTGLFGVNFDGRLQAEDAKGNVLYSSDYGNAFTAGLTVQIRL
jgi:hypothetical protein